MDISTNQISLGFSTSSFASIAIVSIGLIGYTAQEWTRVSQSQRQNVLTSFHWGFVCPSTILRNGPNHFYYLV